MWELEIADREKILPIIFELAEAGRARSTAITHPPDDAPRAARATSTLFAEIYNAAWSAQLGLRPLLQGGPRRLRPGAAARLRPRLVHGRRDARRRGGRRGDHGPGHQPGAAADERARCCRSAGGTSCAARGTSTACRVGFLGVKPEYQHTGVAARLYVEHFDLAARSAASNGGEMGWILETNGAMNRGMEAMGGTGSSSATGCTSAIWCLAAGPSGGPGTAGLRSMEQTDDAARPL